MELRGTEFLPKMPTAILRASREDDSGVDLGCRGRADSQLAVDVLPLTAG
jgi:hypothetical protein